MATHLGNCLQAPVPGLLASMFFRMGLPLAAIIAAPKMGEPFSGSGVQTTILGVYFVALAVETVLAQRMTPARYPAPVAKA
jgi:hypothetical protein